MSSRPLSGRATSSAAQGAETETAGAGSSALTRRATSADLATLARIHRIVYSSNHFTALLGDSALARYYSYFLQEPCEIRLACSGSEDRDRQCRGPEDVEGFAVFGEGIPDRIARFKQECFREILITAARHPVRAARKSLLSAYSRLTRQAEYPPADFLLLSIAVVVPRRGTGGRLLRSTLEAARSRGAGSVGLYVNADNISAINAYFAAGFVIKDFRVGQYYMERVLD
jgi:ribosomal protein S18 acetylase RimI-like enzyme